MKYKSDITREQFEVIRPLLESVKKKSKPRKHNLYDTFCAMLYILQTGCQWSCLPKEYPSYKIVHYYFRNWRNGKILNEVLKKISWRYSYKQWSER